MSKTFKLRILPMFEEDIAAVRDHIAYTLNNPLAALRLIEDTEAAILKRLGNPLGYKPYCSKFDLQYPYYRIHIRNYTVFYVIIEDVMEVRRFVYSKRNLPGIV